MNIDDMHKFIGLVSDKNNELFKSKDEIML